MIRNRKAAREAMALRAWILAMHLARSQAEKRLTVKEIHRQLAYQGSEKAILRHLKWLREHGHLAQ